MGGSGTEPEPWAGSTAPELCSQLRNASHPSADVPQMAPEQGKVNLQPVPLLTAAQRQRRRAQRFPTSGGTRYYAAPVTGRLRTEFLFERL